MEDIRIQRLEEILKDLAQYEKKGLDTSALKIFIKNYKEFIKINKIPPIYQDEISFDEKLNLIRLFLEDEKVFPTIKEVILFANEQLGLEFRDQKASRETTINRIITRIKKKPELKDQLRDAVIKIRNEMAHSGSVTKSKSPIISIETFNKWAEIIKNI